MYNIRNRFAHLMITLLSVGCGSESVNYPSTTMVIGTSGGEISVAGSDGEYALSVPAEALSEDVEITIEARGQGDRMSNMVKFKPSGLIFEKPVKLTFPTNAGDGYQNPTVFYRGNTGALYPIKSSRESGAITADILHFSTYALAEQWAQQSKCVPNFFEHTFDASCKIRGSSGPLIWGTSEWGVEKPWNIAITLLNTTTDMVYVEQTSFTSDNYLGNPAYQWWHSQEVGYYFSRSRDERTRINTTPMSKYLRGVGGYQPNQSLVDVHHMDPTKPASLEVCFKWVQFNVNGVVDEGSDCVSHMGDARPDEPEGEVTWTNSAGDLETCATNCFIYSCVSDRLKCCDYCADVHPLSCDDIRANPGTDNGGFYMCP